MASTSSAAGPSSAPAKPASPATTSARRSSPPPPPTPAPGSARLGSRIVSVHLDGLTGQLRRVGAVVGTFTLQPVEDQEQPEPPTAGGILYGWTLEDLDRLARTVASNNRAWWPAGDRDDLYAAACAIDS